MRKHLETITNYNLYENGTPFQDYPIIDKNLNRFIIEKNDKHPILIILDGQLSSGKTTAAVEFMDDINKRHGFPEVDLENKPIQYAMGGEDFVRKLKLCYEESYPVITYDEAGDFSRKGALTKFNKTLDRVFDTFRAYQIIVILCLPNFAKLSKGIFDSKIPTVLIHLKKRKKNFGIMHFYDLKSMFYIMNNMKTEIFPEAAYDKVYPNFRTKFKDLHPLRSKMLDKISTSNKKDLLEMADIKLQGLMSYDQLSAQLQRSKVWIKQQIKKLSIKPTVTVKKKRYFPQDTLYALQSKIK